MLATNLVLLIFIAVPVGAGTLLAAVIRRHRRRSSILLLVIGNLLVLVCLAGGAMTLGELYYRFAYDKSDALHVSLVGKRWVERHYRYNNLGLRDDVDYLPAIAEGRRRITVLGDSFANGHGVADVEDRYANLLRRTREDWEIHVLAQDGLDTGAILDGLRKNLSAGYQIDCVLYAYGLNDVADLIPEWEPVTRRIYEERPRFPIAKSYLLNTYYYRYQIGSDPDLGHYLDWVGARYDDPLWESQASRLSSLVQVVQRAGGRLVVVSFPFLQALDSTRFAAIHQRLSRYWAGEKVPHLNLLEVYRNHGNQDLMVHRFDPHPNELAHRIAAEAIGPFIERSCAPATGGGRDEMP